MSGCGCGGYSGDDYTPYMQMMNVPTQYYPMATMPTRELETMYPQMYYHVHPAVQGYCDMMGFRSGMDFSPTREQLDSMVDDIYRNVEGQLPAEEGELESRQPFGGFGGGFGGFGRRRFLRDLIAILLIRELLRRRRPWGWGSPGGGWGGYGY